MTLDRSNSLTVRSRPIPISIISLIIEYLDNDHGTLFNLCQVSRSVHEIAIPMLYKMILLSPGNLSSAHNYQPRTIKPNLRLTSSLSKKPPTPSKTNIENGKDHTINHFQYTQYLKLDSHSSIWCKRLTINLSNVKTLIVYPSSVIVENTSRRNRIEIHQDSICKPPLNEIRHTANSDCKIIRDLHPTRLVIHDANLLDLNIPSGIPSSLIQGLEELTFICPTDNSISHHGIQNPQQQQLLTNLKNIKKFTIIFWTKDLLDEWKLTSADKDKLYKPQENILGKSFFSLAKFIINLWNTSTSNQIEISIVNSRCFKFLDDDLRLLNLDDRLRCIKNKLRFALETVSEDSHNGNGNSRLDDDKDDKDEIDELFRSIKWIGTKWFLMKNDHKGIFSDEQVQGWLDPQY